MQIDFFSNDSSNEFMNISLQCESLILISWYNKFHVKMKNLFSLNISIHCVNQNFVLIFLFFFMLHGSCAITVKASCFRLIAVVACGYVLMYVLIGLSRFLYQTCIFPNFFSSTFHLVVSKQKL